MDWRLVNWKTSFAFCLAVALIGCGGESGGDGDPGADGRAGEDGLSALVEVEDEPAGANCAAGGSRVDAGIDENGDGELQESEIANTTYICHGEDGQPGARGERGEKGEKGEKGEMGDQGSSGGSSSSCAGGNFAITSVIMEEDEWGTHELGQTYDVTVTFAEDPGDDVVFSAVGPGGGFADGFARVEGSDVEFRAPWTLEPPLQATTYAIIATDGCGVAVGSFDFQSPEWPTVRAGLTSNKLALPMEGGEVEFCWKSRLAASCELYGMSEGGQEFEFDGLGAEGCETVALSSSAEFEVTCYSQPDEYGYTSNASASLNIVVGPAILEFEALSTTALTSGQNSVDFAWETENVDTCELMVNGSSESVDPNVSENSPKTVQFTETAEVYLTCRDSEGNSVDSDMIIVAMEAYIYDFELGGLYIDSEYQTLEAYWSVQVKNVSTCETVLTNGSYESVRSAPVDSWSAFDGSGNISGNIYFNRYDSRYDFVLTVTCTDLAGESTTSKEFVFNPGPKAALETVDSPLMTEPGDVEFYWTTSEVENCKLFIDGNEESDGNNRPKSDPYRKRFDELSEVYLECVDEDSNLVRSNTIVVTTGPAILEIETTVYMQDSDFGIFEFGYEASLVLADQCEATVVNGAYSDPDNYVYVQQVDSYNPIEYRASGSFTIFDEYDDAYDVELTLTCRHSEGGDPVSMTFVVN